MKRRNKKESFCFELFLLHHRRGSKTSAVSSAAVGAQLRLSPPLSNSAALAREEREEKKRRRKASPCNQGTTFSFSLLLYPCTRCTVPHCRQALTSSTARPPSPVERRRESDFNRQLLNGWKGAIFLAPFFSPPPPPPFLSLPPLMYL